VKAKRAEKRELIRTEAWKTRWKSTPVVTATYLDYEADIGKYAV